MEIKITADEQTMIVTALKDHSRNVSKVGQSQSNIGPAYFEAAMRTHKHANEIYALASKIEKIQK